MPEPGDYVSPPIGTPTSVYLVCSKCQRTLGYEQFHIDRRRAARGHRAAWCKECSKEAVAKSRAKASTKVTAACSVCLVVNECSTRYQWPVCRSCMWHLHAYDADELAALAHAAEIERAKVGKDPTRAQLLKSLATFARANREAIEATP